jgi:hypothetical protein
VAAEFVVEPEHEIIRAVEWAITVHATGGPP